jgi:hypothetical protein
VFHSDEIMTNTASIVIGLEIAKELYALGISLLQLGKAREAAFQFRKALGIAPDFSDASLALGHCLHELREYEEALSVYDRLLTASPLLVAAWNNQGTTLLEMCRYAEAAASYTRALELAPALHDAGVALATCYQALGRVEEALVACDAVLAAAPEHAEAHWNKSLLLLLNGDYQEGWQEYEWRWQKRNFTSPLRHFSQPRWQGEPAVGKTVLIHAEQGFGDTLQFCRYIPLVAARGMRVIFECHLPLVALMKGLTGVAEVVPMGRPLPGFDLHVPLLSLPLIFGTIVETIPADVPHFMPPADRLPFWHSMTADDSQFKAGLCWAGKGYPDPRRSCPVEHLAPLAEIDNVSWYSLQVGWEATLPLPVSDCTGHIHDFGDTAAMISLLDLVITVDTAVAHLAGALGKPTWIMLPQAPDWRWMMDRDDSPWYPSMRLFRQAQPNSWPDVIERVVHALIKCGSMSCRDIELG